MVLAAGLPAWAQDKGGAQYYLNQADTYVGREVSVQCGAVRLVSGPSDANGDLAVFDAETYDRKGWGGGIKVVVSKASAEAFARKYGHDALWRQNGYATKILMGIYSKRGSSYYLRWGGAGEWTAGGQPSIRADSPVAAEAPAAVGFDRSVMPSFTFDGKRYIEATITSVDSEGVKVVDKAGASVVVPLDRAAKIPELRMRARDAIAALSAP